MKKLFESHGSHYYTPLELAEIGGISEHAISQALKRLTQMGYIWRKEEYRKTKSNKYCYGFTKQKGDRVYYELDTKTKITKYTGIFVSLNLKQGVPWEAENRYEQMKKKYGNSVYKKPTNSSNAYMVVVPSCDCTNLHQIFCTHNDQQKPRAIEQEPKWP